MKAFKLYDRTKEAEYQVRLGGEWRAQKERELGSVEMEWKNFKTSVLRCASGVCGVKKLGGERRRGSEW